MLLDDGNMWQVRIIIQSVCVDRCRTGIRAADACIACRCPHRDLAVQHYLAVAKLDKKKQSTKQGANLQPINARMCAAAARMVRILNSSPSPHTISMAEAAI